MSTLNEIANFERIALHVFLSCLKPSTIIDIAAELHIANDEDNGTLPTAIFEAVTEAATDHMTEAEFDLAVINRMNFMLSEF